VDPTNINTLIGIIGAIIGIAGIVVTIISFVRRKTITISTKTKLYINPCEKGAFVFDYSNNNGQYTIGTKENTFNTKWSKASNTFIHAYKDGQGMESIALIKAPVDLSKIDRIEGDFSSRCRTASIGDVVVWKNENGKYALTKIIRIKDDSRGDETDELECEYLILK
jgi:hypothetical protein